MTEEECAAAKAKKARDKKKAKKARQKEKATTLASRPGGVPPRSAGPAYADGRAGVKLIECSPPESQRRFEARLRWEARRAYTEGVQWLQQQQQQAGGSSSSSAQQLDLIWQGGSGCVSEVEMGNRVLLWRHAAQTLSYGDLARHVHLLKVWKDRCFERHTVLQRKFNLACSRLKKARGHHLDKQYRVVNMIEQQQAIVKREVEMYNVGQQCFKASEAWQKLLAVGKEQFFETKGGQFIFMGPLSSSGEHEEPMDFDSLVAQEKGLDTGGATDETLAPTPFKGDFC